MVIQTDSILQARIEMDKNDTAKKVLDLAVKMMCDGNHYYNTQGEPRFIMGKTIWVGLPEHEEAVGHWIFDVNKRFELGDEIKRAVAYCKPVEKDREHVGNDWFFEVEFGDKFLVCGGSNDYTPEGTRGLMTVIYFVTSTLERHFESGNYHELVAGLMREETVPDEIKFTLGMEETEEGKLF